MSKNVYKKVYKRRNVIQVLCLRMLRERERMLYKCRLKFLRNILCKFVTKIRNVKCVSILQVMIKIITY